MAWPTDLKRVACHGFNPKILPHMIAALENENVEWLQDKCSLFIDEGEDCFIWDGCEWKLNEMRELVYRVELVEGTINDIDLTAAVLRG